MKSMIAIFFSVFFLFGCETTTVHWAETPEGWITQPPSPQELIKDIYTNADTTVSDENAG